MRTLLWAVAVWPRVGLVAEQDREREVRLDPGKEGHFLILQCQ